MNKTAITTFAAALAAALVVGCATGGSASGTAMPSDSELDRLAMTMAKASFRDQGLVKVDRLQQDDTNRECSAAQAAGRPLTEARAKAIEAANMKTIKWPADGKFLGDWKEGEKIAQNGRGLTWTDDAKVTPGGNCYNCHQITKEEISFGTIGPSLYNYGKLRGVTDPNSPAAKPMVEYTWGKIWNAKAYNACSNMPRAGHGGVLNEQQIRHIVALLLDPKSPVNQ
ncbi:sulfur oxidation c-type cytochrome SoxX [Ramlibacter sp.]|uniref:sulfur oxidation c-type cytochrome SoxX n=1 Tax=Ramlibacter sp. TaxID=1917967 RepID=UPI002C330129|nr:sulfur oxidation c-type cytochrome SoxX [Ramlibacter sp.]HWI81167.1 sulfur oxidation c-type cytochrome SoxX [Ramlibacter sp.]